MSVYLGVIEKLNLGSDGPERLPGAIVMVCKSLFVCGLLTGCTGSALRAAAFCSINSATAHAHEGSRLIVLTSEDSFRYG